MGACAGSFTDELIQRAVRITLGEKITTPRAARARQTNYQRQPNASIDYPACRLALTDSGAIWVACFHAVAGKHVLSGHDMLTPRWRKHATRRRWRVSALSQRGTDSTA